MFYLYRDCSSYHARLHLAADGLTMDDAMDIILSHHGVEVEIDTIWNSIIL